MSQPLILANQVNSVAQGDVPGTASDQLVCKSYLADISAYTIYGPKAGQGPDDSKIPVYSDFKFSLGATNTGVFDIVDNQARQIVYFAAKTPLNEISWFRAYRYSDNQRFVYDNEPLSVPGLNPSETIAYIINCGTYFLTVYTSQNRTLIIDTNASSAWREWAIAYDMTSVASGHTNFALVSTASGDRILGISMATNTTTLNVYNSALSLLRSQVVLTYSTDLDPTDRAGLGRTVATTQNYDSGSGYVPGYRAVSFAWNKFTETFNYVWTSFNPYKNANNQTIDSGYGLTVSWNVPSTWIESGTGTPTNLIPIKNGTYRYNLLSDSTWDTDTGGMTTSYTSYGQNVTINVDEYSGQTTWVVHGTWDTASTGTNNRINASVVVKSYGSNLAGVINNSFQEGIPDGSYWSKRLEWGMINGSTLIMQPTSTRYGSRWVTAPFSTTSFTSAATTNDTLKLSSSTAQIDVDQGASVPTIVQQNFNPRYLGSTSVGGTPVRYWCRPGYLIHTETVLPTNQLQYTPTTVNVPALPASLGSITLDGTGGFAVVWNGSTSSPVVFCVVYAPNRYQYIAKWSGGSWGLATATEQSMFAINEGNTNRTDTLNLNEVLGSGVLTQSGKYLYSISLPIVGNTAQYANIFDTVANTGNSVSMSQFQPTNVNNPGQYQDFFPTAGEFRSFGYSSTFGYYLWSPNHEDYAAVIVSSRNVETGTTITEQQWIDGSVTRPQKFASTQAATGLVAYMIEFPILLGGYVTTTPEVALALEPNAVNYIYVTKDPSDTTSVTTYVSTQLTPPSFSRLLVAAVTTNATDVVSSLSYSYDGSGLPNYPGNAGKTLSNDGTQLVWVEASGVVRTETASTSIVATDNIGAVILNAANLTATIPNDSEIPVGAKVTVYVGGSFTNNKIAPASGVSLIWMGGGGGTGIRTLAGYAVAELRKLTPTTWGISGQGIS